jgi:MFS family permease
MLGSTMFFVIAVQQAFGLIALGLNDPARIGLLTAISGMGGPIGSLIFRRVVTVRTSRLLFVELAMIGGALFAMSRAATDVQFTTAAAIGMVGAGMLMPTLVTWMVRGLPFAVRSRGVGIFQSVFSLGQFASGLVLPFLALNVAGGMLPAFGLLGLAGLAAAVIAFVRSSMAKPASLQAT